MEQMEKEWESKNITNSEFQPDVLLQILLKLPFSDLPNCRLVCKAWNTCFSSLKLESNHLIAQISGHPLQCVDLDPKHLNMMNIVGSFKLHPTWSSSSTRIANTCNGLLCIMNVELVAILNPMTNEYIELPKGAKYQRYVYGLGYSPKTKQYKVARDTFKNSKLLVEILALGTSLEHQDQSQWTRIVCMSTNNEMHRHGTYFNGAIYWVGEKGAIFFGEKGEVFGASKRNLLWRLNVEDEKFEKLWLPEIGVMWNDSAYCGVFNGRLYLSHYMQDFEYHVWMMDGEGLWERAFSVCIPHKFYKGLTHVHSYNFELIKLCEDGKILCLLHLLLLVLYNPKTGELKKLDFVKDDVNEPFRIYHFDSVHFHPLQHFGRECCCCFLILASIPFLHCLKKMEKEWKSKNIINSEFPPDILLQILFKLPFSNLPTCRLVCKAWNLIIYVYNNCRVGRDGVHTNIETYIQSYVNC